MVKNGSKVPYTPMCVKFDFYFFFFSVACSLFLSVVEGRGNNFKAKSSKNFKRYFFFWINV